MKKGIVVVLFFVLGMVFSVPAEAYLVIIEIEAVVDLVDDDDNYLEGQISINDIITGYYTYESTTADSNPSGSIGRYEHYSAPAGISLSVGGFDFETDASNVSFLMGIVNNGTSNDDGYWLISNNNLALSNGIAVDDISWQIEDATGTALTNDSLPVTAPILSQWQFFNHLRLEADRKYLVDAHVTSAVVIPEPATILLLGSGLLFFRKRNKS